MNVFFSKLQEQIQLLFKDVVEVQQQITTKTTEVVSDIIRKSELESVSNPSDEEE